MDALLMLPLLAASLRKAGRLKSRARRRQRAAGLAGVCRHLAFYCHRHPVDAAGANRHGTHKRVHDGADMSSCVSTGLWLMPI